MYKLSDDGSEAIRAVKLIESNVNLKKEGTTVNQGNKVLWVFLVITGVFVLSVAAVSFAASPASTSPQAFIAVIVALIGAFIGMLGAVYGMRRSIKADITSTEPMTYFPSSKDPWSTQDWLRNLGYFGSYLALFFSLLYVQLSPVVFPAKLIWYTLSLLTFIALGLTSQSMITNVIEKANRKIRKAQTGSPTNA